jgi:DNA-binding transcriptional MerR regulator
MIGRAETPQRRLTIGQVAAQTGLSVRNIRAYQGRGLLQRPEVRGRIGYYGVEHLERIALIQRFHAQGFNLHSIATLVEGGEALLAEIEDLRRDLQQDADSGWVPMSEEGIQLLEDGAPGCLAQLQKVGTIRVSDDGALLTHQIFVEAGWELTRLGVEPATIIELVMSTHRVVSRVGDIYVKVTRDKAEQAIANPTDSANVQAMRESFEQLTPPAVAMMTKLFEVVLRKQAPIAFEQAVRRAAPAAS